MYARILLSSLLLLPLTCLAQVISIQSARSKPLGTVVTVRGIVTSGPELGKIRYFQDGTAGISAFPGSGSAAGFEANILPGDSVEITGPLTSFQGLLEISPVQSYIVIASGLPLPAPRIISIGDVSENLESQLVGFECVTFPGGGGTFTGSQSYPFGDPGGNVSEVYFRSGHPLTGFDIPGVPVFLSGILSQYNADFQILPRSQTDFGPALCFYFVDQPSQRNISTTGFDLSWETNFNAVSRVRYGQDTLSGISLLVPKDTTYQVFHLGNLEPGSIYWVRVESEFHGNNIVSEFKPFATQSLSSGTIKVFFNHAIDPAFANGYLPDGQSSAAVVAETIARIQAAQSTLDVAMYNNSRQDITNALKDAHNRGVRVRYVAALDANSVALDPPPPFPVVYGNTEAIMHDKVIIADADITDKAWVMSGSLNWTNQNINTDFNNTLFIQDQSLARAYRMEFEEMWGSSNAAPNLAAARFGSSKRNNTPHDFIIGAVKMESWFSPSDRTTDRIVETVRNTESEALFATFSFTKNEIADALAEKFHNGTAVRGMIENISDPGVEIDFLKAEGIDCRAHNITGDLHHKYGVFDADGMDPVVVTGSHNWTFSAETVNDENTLIIHDRRIASLFKAEFEKRWQELATPATVLPEMNIAIFPNPASDILHIEWKGAPIRELSIRNMFGEIVARKVSDNESILEMSLSGFPAGQYLVVIRTDHGIRTLPFQRL